MTLLQRSFELGLRRASGLPSYPLVSAAWCQGCPAWACGACTICTLQCCLGSARGCTAPRWKSSLRTELRWTGRREFRLRGKQRKRTPVERRQGRQRCCKSVEETWFLRICNLGSWRLRRLCRQPSNTAMCLLCSRLSC